MSNHQTLTIEPEELPKYIKMSLEEYNGQVNRVIVESTKELSKKVKPELKGYSRRGGQLYRTGVYRSGWARRTINKKGIFQIMTYNKKKPTLVHLLEFGHRPPMVSARPYPHVAKTELKYLEILLGEIIKGVNE